MGFFSSFKRSRTAKMRITLQRLFTDVYLKILLAHSNFVKIWYYGSTLKYSTIRIDVIASCWQGAKKTGNNGSAYMPHRTSFRSLQWRHNGHGGVSNHQPHNCLFRRRSKKASKLRVTGLCERNSPVTGEFPAQRSNNAEDVSIWWRHHVIG